MPYLKIQTNEALAAEQTAALLPRASRLVAELLGKPERYVMVAMVADTPMLFAGGDAPAAYLELKSIGLPESLTGKLSAGLCSLMHEALGIDPERVYIEFHDAARAMWGWNGGTF
jgi:phenylpyruvate tautomerase